MIRETGSDGGEEACPVELPLWSGEPDAGADPCVADARRRWRAAGDRLWPVALADGETYQLAARIVGALVAALRERIGSLDELVACEAAPSAFLAALGATGERAAAQPELLAAACAVRGDELAAEQARRRRAERIAVARADGRAWVEVDRTATRVVEMHLASGTAIVATADPYLGERPFRIAEMVLDTVSGEPLAGPDGDGVGTDATFDSADGWEAGLRRRRREVVERLDTREPDRSDR